jgi:hypothetical protein
MTKKILINVLVGFAVCFGVWFLIAFNSYGATGKLLEKDYQSQWCDANNGVQEYVLDDLARVDCLTETHAVEFDYTRKWAEGLGQSLYYALKTGKKAGLVLIVKGKGEERYIERANKVADKYDITIWTIRPEDLK